MTTDTRSDARPVGGHRFARVGRVLPVALVQIVGTLVATRWAAGVGPGAVGGGGPPWTQRLGDGVDPVFLGPLAWVLLVGGTVVLPFRWRWPVVVLALTLGTTIGYALVVSPRGPFVAALTMALANAWFRGHRVPTYAAAAVATVVLPSADTLTGRAPFPTVTTMTLCLAWLTVTIAVTELVRVRVARAADARRARLAAEQQRAGAERVRIARELHDSVAHSMSLINLQAGGGPAPRGGTARADAGVVAEHPRLQQAGARGTPDDPRRAASRRRALRHLRPGPGRRPRPRPRPGGPRPRSRSGRGAAPRGPGGRRRRRGLAQRVPHRAGVGHERHEARSRPPRHGRCRRRCRGRRHHGDRRPVVRLDRRRCSPSG
ncbi:histidine kinase dimerization/phosphoacceptor domain-containing protein [Curtobacterium sp. MCPF17_052]|nr:histidine kinase dimerization/phosphoacceptor domain-containing protein [Curtobacterium sp. MCPF17_052]WIB11977.1 histidine kinase dimerization/phosphoacceptor domain-containing protein [Curtobacterium sp. MCPF17_052]